MSRDAHALMMRPGWAPLLGLVLHLLAIPAWAYKELSDNFMRLIPSGGQDFDIHTGKLLAPILIPRVSGTPGQIKAQEHLANFFHGELPKWEMIWQNSTSTTPATGSKQVPFANLIFRREPPWTKPGQANLLTLVAHYDSKLTPDGFIGATDSAAPCAMLLHVARSIDQYLTQIYAKMTAPGDGDTPESDMGIQIMFLDGEEAFVAWTATDSLYGARALAKEWENTPYPPKSKFTNPLDQIALFVLLDLLGSPNPSVSSHFLTTHWAYQGMAKIESRMRSLGLLETKPPNLFLHDASKLSAQFGAATTQDDHIPIMARGAPVLHIIDTPFPPVWHTMDDDGEHLDLPTVRDWANVVTAFALEWLDIMDVEPQATKKIQ